MNHMHAAGKMTQERTEDNLEEAQAEENVLEDYTTKIHSMMQRLHETRYQELRDRFPWLQENYILGYIQLLISHHKESELSDIWRGERGDALLWRLSASRAHYTHEQAVDVLLTTLYLGGDIYNPCVQAMLADCMRRVPEMSVRQLHMMSLVSQCVYQSSAGMPQLVPTLKKHLLSGDPWTPDMSADYMQASTNCRRVMSTDLWTLGMDRILAHMQDPAFLSSPHLITMHLQFARRSYFSHFNKGLVEERSREIIRRASAVMCDLLPQMQPRHIGEICSALKACRVYTKDIGEAFTDRAAEILETERCRLADISNLTYALSRLTPLPIKAKFEAALIRDLGESDVIVVSNIAENIITADINNHELIMRLQERIVDNSAHILQYGSRLGKVIRFLTRCGFRSKKMESKFNEDLMQWFKDSNRILLSEWNLSALSSYILSRQQPLLTDKFVRVLQSSVPKWNVPSLYRLAFGLNSEKNQFWKSQKQISQLQATLYESIGKKIDDIDGIDFLYQITLGLVIHSRNPDPVLTDKIMHSYAKYTDVMTDISLMKMMQMFQSLPYFLEPVYEDMVNWAIENKGNIDEEKVFYLLHTCAHVGYLPSRDEQFVELSLGAAESLLAKGEYSTVLSILINLCTLQVYPEPLLLRVFTVDFLQDLDNYIRKHPERRLAVERSMMQLNRAVLLECPQIDIPWFHEQYCVHNIVTVEDKDIGSLHGYEGYFWDLKMRVSQGAMHQGPFCDEVEMALVEGLGGAKYCRRWTYSPYYYTINFECVLDQDQKPVEMSASHDIAEGHQRIAILVMNDDSYCCNSKRLIGAIQAKKRHLEIMGYTVIEIPHFDWFSMGLTEWESKVDYLKTRLNQH